jgi:hypothetical protein
VVELGRDLGLAHQLGHAPVREVVVVGPLEGHGAAKVRAVALQGLARKLSPQGGSGPALLLDRRLPYTVA